MNKAGVSVLMQLLTMMKEAVSKMEAYYRQNDMEKLEEAKREIVSLQGRIERML